MRFRLLNKWRANLGGYFWLPCPLCGKHFGGHEWKDYNGLSSHIPNPEGGIGSGKGICPDCTRAGKGVDLTALMITWPLLEEHYKKENEQFWKYHDKE